MGGKKITNTQIVLQAFLQVIKNFLPVVIFLVVGLAWLSVDERRTKNEK